MHSSSTWSPCNNALHIEQLDGECVVYDPATDLVHCLDTPTAAVFAAATDASAEQIAGTTGLDLNDTLTRLDELQTVGLLTEQGTDATTNGSRRAVLVGSAALAATGIVSIAAPGPADAASQSGSLVPPTDPLAAALPMAFTYAPPFGETEHIDALTSSRDLNTLRAGETATLTVAISSLPGANGTGYGMNLLLRGLEIAGDTIELRARTADAPASPADGSFILAFGFTGRLVPAPAGNTPPLVAEDAGTFAGRTSATPQTIQRFADNTTGNGTFSDWVGTRQFNFYIARATGTQYVTLTVKRTTDPVDPAVRAELGYPDPSDRRATENGDVIYGTTDLSNP